MKIYIYTLFLVITCAFLGSCSDNEWDNGDPAMEHVYYFGFEEWSPKFDNKVTYNVNQGETAAIPVQFYSEQVRKYNVDVTYFVSGLTEGADYVVVDENGTQLTKNADGGYSMLWPNAVKGVKNIYIKALNGEKGAVKVSTFNPNSQEAISYTNTTIALTKEYEVRAFTQNYFVTLDIQ